MNEAVLFCGALLVLSCGSTESGQAGSGGAGAGGTSGVGGTSTGGAGGTSTGGAGGTNTGGAGGAASGGSAGTSAAVSCVADASPPATPGPGTASTVSGTDGSFSDTCDPQGNLIEYACETKQVCTDPPNPSCEVYLTGKTTSQMIDCDGKCQAGRCDSRCPAHGDQVVAKGTNAAGKYLFENATDQRKYACALVFTGTGCAPGSGGTIDGLGLKGNYCTGGELGNIQVAGCSYTCTFAY